MIQTEEGRQGEWSRGAGAGVGKEHGRGSMPPTHSVSDPLQGLGRRLSCGLSKAEFSFHQMPVAPPPRDIAASPSLHRYPRMWRTDPHIHTKKVLKQQRTILPTSTEYPRDFASDDNGPNFLIRF